MKLGRKRFKKEHLLSELIRAYELLGYSPTQEFIDFNPNFPSRGAYRTCFGTFKQAMIEAGLPLTPQGCANPRHPLYGLPPIQLFKNPHRTTKKGINTYLKLRFKILNRDNFTCQYCGRTPKDGVKLQVDHIVPVKKGGKATSDNLITACFDCNMGKRDHLLNKHYKIKNPTDHT